MTHCERISDHEKELYNIEKTYTSSAVTKRKHEFSTGRLCSRKVLEQLNQPACPILIGAKREPIWPQGITGSISHDGDHCIVSAASKIDVYSIGVDLALAEPLNENLIKMICTKEDIRCIQSLGESKFAMDPYKLIFSIKEAVYKCLFPIVNEFFDFQDVSICLNPTNVISFTLLNDRLFSSLDLDFKSRFLAIDKYIFTIVWLEAT